MKIIIIGASAARTIKEVEPNTQVTVISRDDCVHSRCMLHHFLGHERDEAGISFVDGQFFADNHIIWLKNTAVIGLNTAAKAVKTDDGQQLFFDKLLIATGASYFVPPIPGLREATNVYGFRDLKDARLLDTECETAKNAVVIGAGLVGMDAAAALLKRGLKVTIIEMMDRILGLQLDEKSAAPYRQLFEERGADFLLSEKVVAVDLDETGRGETIHLASGKSVPADVIVIAAGIRPAFDFLSDTGIITEKAVLVGDDLQTNIADIYAAGDVTGLSGIWPNAMKQGRIAAINMLGERLLYDDRFAIKNTVNFYGLTTLSVGNVNPRPEENCDVILREDRSSYRKIVMKDGRITGVIIQGDIGGTGFFQHLIKQQINLSCLNKDVFDIDYADFYAVDPENGEYHYAV